MIFNSKCKGQMILLNFEILILYSAKMHDNMSLPFLNAFHYSIVKGIIILLKKNYIPLVKILYSFQVENIEYHLLLLQLRHKHEI